MLRTVRRRISNLEESTPIREITERFLTRAYRHAERAGGSVDSSIAILARDIDDDQLDVLTTEFEQIAFGADIAAGDAAKREALAAANYPMLDNSDR
jgi:hypothetical protein